MYYLQLSLKLEGLHNIRGKKGQSLTIQIYHELSNFSIYIQKYNFLNNIHPQRL